MYRILEEVLRVFGIDLRHHAMASLQARAFAKQSRFFQGLGHLVSSKTAAIVCVVIAIAIGAACTAGLTAVERETSITELCKYGCRYIPCDNVFYQEVTNRVR